MTKSEAIRILKDLTYEREFEGAYNCIKEITAINIAIKAIEFWILRDLNS